MSLTVDFSPREEARIDAVAREKGTDWATVLRDLVREHLPDSDKISSANPDEENLKVIALLRAWREEDKTDDETELARRDNENREMMRNLAADRTTFPVPEP